MGFKPMGFGCLLSSRSTDRERKRRKSFGLEIQEMLSDGMLLHQGIHGSENSEAVGADRGE